MREKVELSEYEMENLREGNLQKVENDSKNRKFCEIEDMNRDELTYFCQQIENEIENLLNRIAQNLAYMVYYGRKKHRENTNRWDQAIKRNREDYNFNAMLLAIQRYELHKIRNRLQPEKADSGEKGKERK